MHWNKTKISVFLDLFGNDVVKIEKRERMWREMGGSQLWLPFRVAKQCRHQLLGDSFPVSTIADCVDSVSCILFSFSHLQPLMQRWLLLRRAKFSFDLMYETTSAYGSFLMPLIKLASHFIDLVADGLSAPVHEKISVKNMLFSTLMTRSFTFLFASWNLFAFGARCSIRVEDLDIERCSSKSWLPNFICFVVQSRLMFSDCGFVIQVFTS